jgi:putative restriction endonuclease
MDRISSATASRFPEQHMFDCGLISLLDDLGILLSRQANGVDGIRAIINKSGRALMPARTSDQPHPHFLAWHREHCFKH